MEVSTLISQHVAAGKKMLAVLIDPEKTGGDDMLSLCSILRKAQPQLVLVGGSTGRHIETAVDILKQQTQLPIVLFPGNPEQFTPKADALLFLSLLSGRNPEMLIGAQVRVAARVMASGIETLPMGYILVDGGKVSSVQKASGTTPLSSAQEIVSTAQAAQLLGMQLVYLEAGSGAAQPVSPDIISAVRRATRVTLIVGGGITSPEQMQTAFRAGADIVVIGNHFEHQPEQIPDFCTALGQYDTAF